MEDWLKKVEEMKKMRGSTNPDKEPTTATPNVSGTAAVTATTAKANPFLTKGATTNTTTTATTSAARPSNVAPQAISKPTQPTAPTTPTPAVTTNSSAPKANPFLNRAVGGTTATTSTNTSITPINTSSPSSTAPKANPFLAKAASSSTLNNSTSKISSTTSSASSSTNNSPMVPSKSSSKDGLSTDADSVGSSIYKIKYEQEVKKRQELEQKILILEGKVDPQKAAEVAAEMAAKKREARKTKRMTQKIRTTQRMSIHVGNTVDMVLQQIGGLDKKIRAAEAARMQAEDKLLEIAIAKLEVDEVIQKVDTVLKKMCESCDKFTIPQIKEMLMKVRTQTASNEEGGNSKAASRFTIIIPAGGLQLDESGDSFAPPPPSLTPPPAPAFNSSNSGNNTVNNNNNSNSSPSTSKNSLLAQIRAGTSLKNINVDKLREEQKQLRANAKKSLNEMMSLEDTLRSALTNRVLDMNLYEDEQDDTEDDDWD